MTHQFFIPKPFNTYADTFLMLGVARLLETIAQSLTGQSRVQLQDHRTHYQLRLSRPVDLAAVAQLPYTHPFVPVRGGKTAWEKMPDLPPGGVFDTVAHSERRKAYRTALYQKNNELNPPPPDPRTQTGTFLTSQKCDRNHNNLWLDSWAIREQYGALLAALLQALSQPHPTFPTAAIGRDYQKRTGAALPKTASAVKVYLPQAVQGVNRKKADSNQVDAQKTDWLSLWLITSGLLEFALAERVKVGDSTYDWRVVAIAPKQISLSNYRGVLAQLRVHHPPSGGHGSARFDSELILKLCQELLNYHEARMPEDDPFAPPPEVIGTLAGSHFNSKGQSYGVKELFTLGLPGWMRPANHKDCEAYQRVIEEHLAVLWGLKVEEGHSELLLAYRHFITSPDVTAFFPFAVRYADFILHQLAKPDTPSPRLFSVSGLNLMVKQDVNVRAIVENPSFQRIAKAINQATVYAGKIKTPGGEQELDWQRQYGLAQVLSSQGGSKTEFVSAIADFLGKYSHENLRLKEQYLRTGQDLYRIQITTDDLNGLIALVEDHNTTLIANLLIAYGYARWPAKAKDPDPTAKTEEE